jgi:hypothetical protein
MFQEKENDFEELLRIIERLSKTNLKRLLFFARGLLAADKSS